MTTTNHGNTRLTPCTCQRQVNQEHRRSRTRKAPKEPHATRWLGDHKSVLCNSLACLSVQANSSTSSSASNGRRQNSKACCPLFIVIGHKCNELARNATEVRPLEEQLFGDDQAQDVTQRMRHGLDCGPDKGIHSRASSHKPMLCSIHTLMHNV